MEFVAGQGPATTELQKALINKESAPYMPDLVAIVYQVSTACTAGWHSMHDRPGSSRPGGPS